MKLSKGNFVVVILLNILFLGLTKANTLEEIVVTAERKESNLQQTPIAVSALSAGDIESLQMSEFQEIDIKVPGLTIQSNVASATALAFTLRGTSEPNAAFLFSEPGIGLYMNGVYRRLNAGNIELADIERIEVLRGPQGTLFGRNTLAGAINIVTRKPTEEYSGEVAVSYDSFDTAYVRGSVGGAISDNINVSVSAVLRDRNEGPFDNQYDGADIGKRKFTGLQGNLLWTFGDDNELSLSLYSTEDENDGVLGSPLDITSNEFIFEPFEIFAASTVNGGVGPFSIASQDGFDATLTVPLTDSTTLKYITSYNQTDSSWGVDFTSGAAATGCRGFDCVPGFFRISDGEQEQFSHELQLLGSSDKLDWIVGLYYFDEETNQVLQDEFFGFPPPASIYNLESDSSALFGQLSYQVTDQLALTAGGRYTKDKKRFSGSIRTEIFLTEPDWSDFTGKLGLEYQLNDDMLMYFTWSQGNKAGTFNAFAPAQVIVDPLEPETVDSIELGFKGTLLENTLQLNAALYSANYEELVVGGQGVGGLFTTNGGETDVRGLEIESTWLINNNLTSFVTFNYLIDSTWDDTSGSLTTRVGDQLPNTKELQWTLGTTYTYDLANNSALNFTATVQYDDETFSIANHQNNPVELIDDRTLVNFRLNYISADEKNQFWLSGKNIFDEESYFRVANFTFLPTNTAFVTPNPGKSFEIGYKYSF